MTLLTEALDRILNCLHQYQRQNPNFSQNWNFDRTETRNCKIYHRLQPGLSSAEIAEITENSPESLPPEVIELYRWRNGSDILHPYMSDWLFNFGRGWGWGCAASLIDLQSVVKSYRDRSSHNLEDVTVDNLVTNRWHNNTIKLFDAFECVEGYMVMNQNRKSYPIVFWDFKGGCDEVYAKYASLTDMMVTIAEYYESSTCEIKRNRRNKQDLDKLWEIWRKHNSQYWVNLALRNIDLMENKLPPWICDERISYEIVREAGDTWKFSQDIRLAEALSNFLKQPPTDSYIDNELKFMASIYLGYHGNLALDFLLPILKDIHWQNRYEVIGLLGRIKDDRSVPALVDCLEDENEHVRIRTRISLARIHQGDK